MSDVEKHYIAAVNAGLAEVERLARKILRKHPRLDEFVMAMGLASFRAGDNGISVNAYRYMKPLHDFLCEWDDVLRLTGYPMRFTAEGPKTTDW